MKLSEATYGARQQIADHIVERGWDCEAVVDAVEINPAAEEFAATWS